MSARVPEADRSEPSTFERLRVRWDRAQTTRTNHRPKIAGTGYSRFQSWTAK